MTRTSSYSTFGWAFALIPLVFSLAGCDSSWSMAEGEDDSTEDAGNLPAAFEHFTDDVTVTLDGDEIVLVTTGVPNHGSPYFAAGTDQYEAYNGTNPNFRLNPNQIRAAERTYRIPLNPQEASTKSATPLGPIGISVNGVPIYNQYAGPDQPLTREIDSFDQYNGHPQNFGEYHYHIEPLYITATRGRDALIGFLLDGFPVYGPEEDGRTVTNADLDEYHGHFGPTPDYPNGIYHYHITDQDPYINGNGFFGTAGTVTR